MDYPNKLFEIRTTVRGISQKDVADALGVSQSEYSRLEIGKRRIGSHKQSLIEFFVSKKAMKEGDSLTENSVPIGSEPKYYQPDGIDLPVYGNPTIEGKLIMDNKPISLAPRPPAFMGNDCYATYVAGDDMIPRLYRRNKCFVDPSKPIFNGSLVLVRFIENEKEVAYFREFVSQDKDSIQLKQYNPETTETFKTNEICSIHPINAVSYIT